MKVDAQDTGTAIKSLRKNCNFRMTANYVTAAETRAVTRIILRVGENVK
jgi:hypothetical protein